MLIQFCCRLLHYNFEIFSNNALDVLEWEKKNRGSCIGLGTDKCGKLRELVRQVLTDWILLYSWIQNGRETSEAKSVLISSEKWKGRKYKQYQWWRSKFNRETKGRDWRTENYGQSKTFLSSRSWMWSVFKWWSNSGCKYAAKEWSWKLLEIRVKELYDSNLKSLSSRVGHS